MTDLVFVVVQWGFCNNVISLWWENKWVGSVWMVTKSNPHHWSKTNKMVNENILVTCLWSSLSITKIWYLWLSTIFILFLIMIKHRWFAKRFLHPDVVAEFEYIFIWDEDLGVDNFTSEEYVELFFSSNSISSVFH